jgi:hypothetical protein
MHRVCGSGTRFGVAAVALAAVTLATACGGGSSDPPPPPSPPPPPPGTGFQFGTPGPWPVENRTFGAADGIRERSVVGFTTDEAQNRWLATHRALYLLRPGDTAFRRLDQRDGLHFDPDLDAGAALAAAVNGGVASWALYCNGAPAPAGGCGGRTPRWGGGIAPGITEIVGGGPGEVFVGYAGTEPVLSTEDASDWEDPGRHTGKIDRVRLEPDGSITVDRLDLVANNHGLKYWHDRTVQRLAFDHFVHRHTLYAGTNHGVVLLQPDRLQPLLDGQIFNQWINGWMGDHLHARVCAGAPCDPASSANQRMGDWRGLAVDGDGDLWHAGKWTAGLISYHDDPATWVGRNAAAFLAAFGDPYPMAPNDEGFRNEPVFAVAAEGDPVHLTGVAVCPDGRVWFSSSGPTGRDETLAVWNGRSFRTYRASEAGAGEARLSDVVCLPDGRLVLATQSSGLAVFDPSTGASRAIRAGDGIPDDAVLRLDLDRMANPPSLHVSTAGGAAVLRVWP